MDALCLGVNVLPHHLHNQDTFPFWLLALSLMKEQWKILVKGSNSVSSPPPLSTDKSTKLVCAVSAETAVSCDGVVASFNIAGPTGGRWGALILKWIDMDEPAQCFAVAYAADCPREEFKFVHWEDNTGGASKYPGWTDCLMYSYQFLRGFLSML